MPREAHLLPRGIRLRNDWSKGRVSKKRAYAKCIDQCVRHDSCVSVWWRTRARPRLR